VCVPEGVHNSTVSYIYIYIYIYGDEMRVSFAQSCVDTQLFDTSTVQFSSVMKGNNLFKD